MYTASAQSCQQTRGRFAFFWRVCLGFWFGGFSLVWVFRLVLAFWPVFVAFVFWCFGGSLTSLEPTCHLDDIVQCLWWLITTADTSTAPERVSYTCTYFSWLNLWSEWELAGRNFFRDLKKKKAIRSWFLGWWLFFVCFPLALFVASFAGFSWPFLWVFFGFPFGCSAVLWALFLRDSRRVWIRIVTG